jgi:hypothetical protein
MGWTLAAYDSNVTGTAAFVQINALTDQSQTIINNGFLIPPAYPRLAAAYLVGAHADIGLLTAPSLRKYANYYISPADTAANPTDNPPFEYMGFYNPLPMTIGDRLEADVLNNTNTEHDEILVWLSDGKITPVFGPYFTVYCTSTTTLTADQWTLGSLTPQTSLEEGVYAVVGMHTHFNGAIAARLVPPGNLSTTRPGCIAASDSDAPMPLVFRNGRLGEWFRFDAAIFPQIEFLGNAATTSERVFLDLCKLSTGLGVPANIGYSAVGSPTTPTGMQTTPLY